MITTEKLDAIVRRCKSNITISIHDDDEANSGWRSTIIAIEGIKRIGYTEGQIADEIIAAWEGIV